MFDHSALRGHVVSILKRAGIVRPHIDLRAVTDVLGINYSEDRLSEDISGLSFIDGAEKYVVVNKSHHANRKRFTAAHEIGHHVMHADILRSNGVHVDKRVLRRDRSSSAGVDRREIEANAFAAELLMPESFLEACVDPAIDLGDDEAIAELAKKFKVSTSAMNFRLVNLWS